MFGRSIFRDDPFFSNSGGVVDQFEQMDRMMSSFHQSFGMPSPMMPALGAPPGSRSYRGGNQPNSRNAMMPFGGGGMLGGGGMFGGNMFQDMNSMMQSMSNNPNGQFYSSSQVISYSSDGTGQPKYYQATTETTHGPDGVRQTKKSERNSETGVDRMAVGHHIYDRGHVVERIRNNRTNEREEKQDFLNLDEDERDAFHQEWRQKSRSSRRSERRHEPRAIGSAEYHRQNLERSRARHRDTENRRQDDRCGHINSRAEEI